MEFIAAPTPTTVSKYKLTFKITKPTWVDEYAMKNTSQYGELTSKIYQKVTLLFIVLRRSGKPRCDHL